MRARLKQLADLDPKFKCCHGTVAAWQPLSGKVMELVGASYEHTQNCPFCGKSLTMTLRKTVDGIGGIPMECVDIDEGAAV